METERLALENLVSQLQGNARQLDLMIHDRASAIRDCVNISEACKQLIESWITQHNGGNTQHQLMKLSTRLLKMDELFSDNLYVSAEAKAKFTRYCIMQVMDTIHKLIAKASELLNSIPVEA